MEPKDTAKAIKLTVGAISKVGKSQEIISPCKDLTSAEMRELISFGTGAAILSISPIESSMETSTSQNIVIQNLAVSALIQRIVICDGLLFEHFGFPDMLRENHGQGKAESEMGIVAPPATGTTDCSSQPYQFSLYSQDKSSSLDEEMEQILSESPANKSEIPDEFAQFGEIPECGCLPFKKKHSFAATIVTAFSPTNFYIELLAWRSLKKRMELQLNEMYMESSRSFGRTNHELLERGLIVACCYQGFWSRAEILSPRNFDRNGRPFSYKVLLIDDGEVCRVTQSQIRYLHKDFLEQRRTAQKCSLDNFGLAWSRAAVARFQSIVTLGSHIYVKLLRSRNHVWEVSFKTSIFGNSKLDQRYVEVGQELGTFQRRERVAAMHMAPLEADDDDGDSGNADSVSDDGVPAVKRLKIVGRK